MKPGAGKSKGSGYEREVGYKLSLWLSGGERKDLVCRTVGSGGQFTTANLRGTTAGIPGDLRSQHPLADKFFDHIVLECKFWRDLEFLRFLNGEGLLHEAMVKVRKEAEQMGKWWWLVCRQNRRYDILLMPVQALSRCKYDSCYNPCPTPLNFHAIFNGQVYMYKLDDFLKAISPGALLSKEVLKER